MADAGEITDTVICENLEALISDKDADTNDEVNEASLLPTDDSVILKIIDTVRKSREGQYFENITRVAQEDHSWSLERTKLALDSAVSSGALKEVTVRGKISYRLKSLKNVSIHDSTEHVGTSMHEDLEEYENRNALEIDYTDFKRHMFDELSVLKLQVQQWTTENQLSGEENVQNIHPLNTSFSKQNGECIENVDMNHASDGLLGTGSLGHVVNSPSMHCEPNSNITNLELLKLENRYKSSIINTQSERINSLEATVEHQRQMINYIMNINKSKPQKADKASTEDNSLDKNQTPRQSDNKSSQFYSSKHEKNNQNQKTANNRTKQIVNDHRVDADNGTSHKTESKNSKKKLNIVVVGDSHLNAIDEQRLRQTHYVRVRNHPGATSADLVDHIKPISREKVDHIIYHGCCNDLNKPSINSINNVKEMVKTVKELSPQTQVTISLHLPRDDEKDMKNKVKVLNENLIKFCKENSIAYISNSNVRTEMLGRRKVHLNGEGLKVFAGNISRCIRKLN